MSTTNRQIPLVSAAPSTRRRVNREFLSLTMAIGHCCFAEFWQVRQTEAERHHWGNWTSLGIRGWILRRCGRRCRCMWGINSARRRKADRECVVSVIGKKAHARGRGLLRRDGRTLIYVGLPGETYKPFVLNPAPTGSERLPVEIVSLESTRERQVRRRSRKEETRRRRTTRSDTRCRRIPQPERYRCRCGRGRWNISRSWCRYCVRLRMRGSARLQAKFWVMRSSRMNKLRRWWGGARSGLASAEQCDSGAGSSRTGERKAGGGD